jgi:hypothetical protein
MNYFELRLKVAEIAYSKMGDFNKNFDMIYNKVVNGREDCLTSDAQQIIDKSIDKILNFYKENGNDDNNANAVCAAVRKNGKQQKD